MTNPDPPDDYEHLGPKMRARLDRAEMDQARMRDYIGVLAERDRQANGIARELCILLDLARPRDWYVIAADRRNYEH